MSKIKFFSVFLFLFTISLFSQKSLNDYKYVIVPSQYGFQKAEGSYQLNSLTKFLFNKAGFTTLLSTDNLPDDLAMNRCLALTAKLKKSSSMFSTKMNFDLVNCKNVVVFSTREASSKEKDYKKAYHEALRKTFEDIKAKNYKYSPKQPEEVVEVLRISDAPMKEIIVKKKNNIITPTIKKTSDILYAQSINNGFQLVDSTPEKVYIIKKTSVKDVFILEVENGILYKNNNQWIAEYYSNNQLIREVLNIKF